MKRYKAPRNAAERIAETRAAIARLEEQLRHPMFNHGGEGGRDVYDAIARWQAVIEREESK